MTNLEKEFMKIKKRNRNRMYGFIVYSFLFIMIIILSIFVLFEDIIQENEELVCYIGNEYKVIDKEKIRYYNSETNTWVFTNGYARNCEIEKF